MRLVDGNLDSELPRKTVNPGGDCGERDRMEVVRHREAQAGGITAGKQPRFARTAAAPDRPHGVDDMARLQAVTARDLGLTRGTAAKRAALRKQAGTGGTVNRAI